MYLYIEVKYSPTGHLDARAHTHRYMRTVCKILMCSSMAHFWVCLADQIATSPSNTHSTMIPPKGGNQRCIITAIFIEVT